MRNKHSLIWSMARNTPKCGKCEMHSLGPGVWRYEVKIMENEKYTLQDLNYEKKTEKKWKMRNAHSRDWSMARKIKIMENEKQTWQDMNYGEKH